MVESVKGWVARELIVQRGAATKLRIMIQIRINFKIAGLEGFVACPPNDIFIFSNFLSNPDTDTPTINININSHECPTKDLHQLMPHRWLDNEQSETH